MTDEDWTTYTRCLGVRLAGDAIDDVDARGERVAGDTLLILINAHWEPIGFTLPTHVRGERWELILDTHVTAGPAAGKLVRGGDAYPLESRSLAVFRLEGGRRLITPRASVPRARAM
jgi:glycogen operon protein